MFQRTSFLFALLQRTYPLILEEPCVEGDILYMHSSFSYQGWCIWCLASWSEASRCSWDYLSGLVWDLATTVVLKDPHQTGSFCWFDCLGGAWGLRSSFRWCFLATDFQHCWARSHPTGSSPPTGERKRLRTPRSFRPGVEGQSRGCCEEQWACKLTESICTTPNSLETNR